MSGTSVDGIDAVLLELPSGCKPTLVDTTTFEFEPWLREKIVRLTQPGDDEITILGTVHTALGECYGKIANELIHRNPHCPIAVIGCHGQTVRHHPDEAFPFTLQLGNGAVIAARTGVATVTDFRSADIAMGGQGAPFAPFFHRAIFSDESATRAIVNLGGIANISILPKDLQAPLIGFDSGPANGLMDVWAEKHIGVQYDDHGHWASQGTCDQLLLDLFLADDYFSAPYPKSTGRERFNLQWIIKHIAQLDTPPTTVDVQQTLAHLTAVSITRQIPPGVDEIYLCGGGTNNDHLISLLQKYCSATVSTTQALNFDTRWIEASAFAWMAIATMDKQSCTAPSVTGASHPSVTGAIYYPPT